MIVSTDACPEARPETWKFNIVRVHHYSCDGSAERVSQQCRANRDHSIYILPLVSLGHMRKYWAHLKLLQSDCPHQGKSPPKTPRPSSAPASYMGYEGPWSQAAGRGQKQYLGAHKAVMYICTSLSRACFMPHQTLQKTLFYPLCASSRPPSPSDRERCCCVADPSPAGSCTCCTCWPVRWTAPCPAGEVCSGTRKIKVHSRADNIHMYSFVNAHRTVEETIIWSSAGFVHFNGETTSTKRP